MKEEIFNDLVAFIHKQSRSFDIPVTMETSIENDLGITGDDGEDFIINFSRKYGIDISNFYFTKYFYPEPSMSTLSKEIKILTVGHLMKAIEARRLDDNIINE
jgi:acyl carrier protein